MATRARLWALGVAGVALAAACAKSGKGHDAGTVGSGDSSDAASQVSTAAGTGGAGATSTSGKGGAASSSTVASSSASGPMCSESPCKLTTPQCGCMSGQQCTLNGAKRICVPAGNVGTWQACDAQKQCGPGLLCVGITPTLNECANFCAMDSECNGPGGICVLTLDDGNGGSIPGVTLCSQNCDPATAAGCPPGTGCQLGQEKGGQMRVFSRCMGAGAGIKGSLCATNLDCAPNYGCIGQQNNNNVCLRWCKVGGANCGGGESCSPFAPSIKLGSVEYGACI